MAKLLELWSPFQNRTGQCNVFYKNPHLWRWTKKSRLVECFTHIWREIQKHTNWLCKYRMAAVLHCSHGYISSISTLLAFCTRALHSLLNSCLLFYWHKFQPTYSFLRGSSITGISFPATSGKNFQSVLVFSQWFQFLLTVMKAGSSCCKWPLKGTRRQLVFSQEKKNCFSSFSQQQNKQQHNLIPIFHHWRALGWNYFAGSTLQIMFLVYACIFLTHSKGFLWALPLVDASKK